VRSDNCINNARLSAYTCTSVYIYVCAYVRVCVPRRALENWKFYTLRRCLHRQNKQCDEIRRACGNVNANSPSWPEYCSENSAVGRGALLRRTPPADFRIPFAHRPVTRNSEFTSGEHGRTRNCSFSIACSRYMTRCERAAISGEHRKEGTRASSRFGEFARQSAIGIARSALK